MTRMNLTAKGIISLFLPIVFLCACGVPPEKSPSVIVPPPGIDLLIKKRLTEWKAPSKAKIRGEQIYAAVLSEGFYKERNYQPAWSREGRPTQAETLINAVEEAYGDGLTPDYYHLGLIKSLIHEAGRGPIPDFVLLADLDILLTDAFLTLGCHLSAGCANPSVVEPEWFEKRRNVDVSALLEKALKAKEIKEALVKLRPQQDSYERLKRSLARYRELSSKGEWPRVSNGKPMKKGLVSSRVLEMRKRLAFSSDPEAAEAAGNDFFDDKLERAVMVFQKRHGINADGIVGSATLNALNVPLTQRIRQIELNMERLRWILGNQDEHSIVINIANFELGVIENGRTVLSMKVVVGKPFWRTPVFTAKMAYLLINPPWNVPDSIARRELIKTIKGNPGYLVEQNIKVLRGWGAHEQEVDPETIDWSRITPEHLPYRFRQEPGPLNPLGRIKFMFPNEFDVYLHDTPAKQLFSKDMRAFSHGCTRIEKPIELAEYLLRDSAWTKERLLSAIEEGVEQRVDVSDRINVHFLYLTAWVDDDGILQLRDDIYGRDKLLDEILRKKSSLR